MEKFIIYRKEKSEREKGLQIMIDRDIHNMLEIFAKETESTKKQVANYILRRELRKELDE